MARQRILPIEPKLQVKLFTREELEAFHQAALEVMEEVGVSMPSHKALDILAGAGATVNREKMHVKLPRGLVEKALETAPKRYVLGARDPDNNLDLDGKHCYLSTDGCGIETYDLWTGTRRLSTKKDIEDSARLADSLPAIAFYWGPMVSAQDVPAKTRPLHELQAAFAGTAKHVQPETIIDEEVARYSVEMAAVVAGGYEELRKRPVLSVMQCAMDPLGQDGGSLEASLVAAEHGLPTGFMPMPMSCATAPATLAGNLVVTTVDALAPLVLMQTAHPGSPFFFAAAPTAIDLRLGSYTGGGPEDYLLAAGFQEICAHYGIPLSMGTMATGAKMPDWQAAVDNVFSTVASVFTTVAMMTGAGMLNGSKIMSFQEIIMDAEIYEIARRFSQGIPVDRETLAVDVIKEVGIGGNYLSHKHTRAHMREIWRPTIVDRSPLQVWETSGRAGAFEKATEIAQKTIREYETQPLAPEAQRELEEIIRKADAGLSD
ncbi:MAG TPA: trimethylamine methyltransferase family protein [Bacillota bacterium]|jgi:trimethylamine--corrinoid protein Co-methyltransferase